MKKTLKKSSKMPESVQKRLKREKLLSMKYPTSGFNTKVRRDRIINNPHLYTSKSISKSASNTNTGETKHGGRRRKKNRRKSRRKSKQSKRKSRRKSRGKKR